MDVTSERYGPLVHRSVHHGAILWIVGVVQFVVAMIVTQLGWTTSYSLTGNSINDLGNTACGWYSGRYVCSPWHLLFNVSAVVLGILLILGVLLVRTGFATRRARSVGLGLLGLAGLGSIGVGLSPENVNLTVDSVSAILVFAGGALALIVLPLAMFRDTRWDGFRGYTLLSGLVGLVALILFSAGAYGPLRVGGMERLIVAPVFLWAVVVAIHLLRMRSYAPRGIPRVVAT